LTSCFCQFSANDSLYIKESQDISQLCFPSNNLKLKDFKIKDSVGNFLTNMSIKGKTVFINFWFASCPPCIYEIPSLNNLYSKYKKNKNFVFLSVTYEPDSVINAFRKKHKITFPIFTTTSKECKRLTGGAGYPTNMIFNSKGKIAMLRCGGPVDYPAVERDFRLMFIRKLDEIFLKR
jgi:thiol-disulfide isomerase/thioredoxin